MCPSLSLSRKVWDSLAQRRSKSRKERKKGREGEEVE
jgi:hypothetical protein